jgi:hypothetical protein
MITRKESALYLFIDFLLHSCCPFSVRGMYQRRLIPFTKWEIHMNVRLQGMTTGVWNWIRPEGFINVEKKKILTKQTSITTQKAL